MNLHKNGYKDIYSFVNIYISLSFAQIRNSGESVKLGKQEDQLDFEKWDPSIPNLSVGSFFVEDLEEFKAYK